MIHRSTIWRLVLVLVVAAWGGPSAQAVIIVESGNEKEPVRGYLVNADATRLVVDVLLPDGTTRQRIFPRSGIVELIEAVSVERLEALRREKPEEYRDYAEELAGKTNDPDAQRTALRLYQIAAYLDPERLGRSCLLGMVPLARSPAEERTFRAVAYLLDRDHDRTVLKTAPTVAVEVPRLAEDQIKLLRSWLRSLRDGRIADARGMASRPALQRALPSIAKVITAADVTDLRAGVPLPPAVLAKVLAAEQLLDGGGPRETPPPRLRLGWSDLGTSRAPGPVPPLSLEWLTEFPPRDCEFRGGKWVAPQ